MFQRKKKIINLKLNRYIYANKELDFTLIKILEQDHLSDFLFVDEFIHSKDYENEDIFCIQFPKRGKLTVKLGQNFEKNGMYFYYQLETNSWSSGSPILLLDNKKLIGIHKGI